MSVKEAEEIYELICAGKTENRIDAELVVTAPVSFAIKAKPTKTRVIDMIKGAKSSILITGYSLSDYFDDLIDCIIRKSQQGVFVKFYINDIESQNNVEKLSRYKGKFLKIYNYPKHEGDKMSALHAKVISVDQEDTLITSANLSYHGQEGNIELGTRVKSKDIAKQVEDLFARLVFLNVIEEMKQ